MVFKFVTIRSFYSSRLKLEALWLKFFCLSDLTFNLGWFLAQYCWFPSFTMMFITQISTLHFLVAFLLRSWTKLNDCSAKWLITSSLLDLKSTSGTNKDSRHTTSQNSYKFNSWLQLLISHFLQCYLPSKECLQWWCMRTQKFCKTRIYITPSTVKGTKHIRMNDQCSFLR
jgi:hypothetical protein